MDTTKLLHSEITARVIEVFFDVYNELGPGFLESVYKRAMVIALAEHGLEAQPEFPVPVWFRGHDVGVFSADILVQNTVILELQAARAPDAAHEAKLLHYLRATDKEVGLLFNFGPTPVVRRLVFANARKRSIVRTGASGPSRSDVARAP